MAFSETLTADGQSDAFVAPGEFVVHLKGTFGSGTIKLQREINGEFESITGRNSTSDDDYIYGLPGDGGTYRFDLSGSTTPTIATTALGAVKSKRVFV
jgi:hypothetical protein